MTSTLPCELWQCRSLCTAHRICIISQPVIYSALYRRTLCHRLHWAYRIAVKPVLDEQSQTSCRREEAGTPELNTSFKLPYLYWSRNRWTSLCYASTNWTWIKQRTVSCCRLTWWYWSLIAKSSRNVLCCVHRVLQELTVRICSRHSKWYFLPGEIMCFWPILFFKLSLTVIIIIVIIINIKHLLELIYLSQRLSSFICGFV